MIFLCLLLGALARGDESQINAEGPHLSFRKVKPESKAANGRRGTVGLQLPEFPVHSSGFASLAFQLRQWFW